MTTLDAYLRATRTRVDAALTARLPRPPSCPAALADAVRYSVMAGGKRLRPILTLATAEAILGDADRAAALAIPAACALEFIHTYSLIHDDLPAMDDDDLRRGQPTSHVVFGEALAILAGDALLTEAFVLLATEPASEDPAVVACRLRTIARIAEAAGAGGMVGGQVLDLAAEERPGAGHEARGAGLPSTSESGEERLRRIHAAKTGALIRAAVVSGGIMAGADERQVEAVDGYATHVGLAFQIIDDVLDVEGEAATLGKTAGKDEAAGKLTYPSLFGVDGSRRLADEAVVRAKAALAEGGIRGRLAEIADYVVRRSS
ncbi:MAG: farnesyl diphosphate synthase [Vicinamibacterales bacterium]